MGSFSLWHWLIVLAIVLVLFGGGGKIPRLMKDLGQGITAFKKGLKTDDKSGPEGQANSASGDDKHGMIDRG
jgi:sec-independent protein translocase protein TatA